jgi:hypothetical protein
MANDWASNQANALSGVEQARVTALTNELGKNPEYQVAAGDMSRVLNDRTQDPMQDPYYRAALQLLNTQTTGVGSSTSSSGNAMGSLLNAGASLGGAYMMATMS